MRHICILFPCYRTALRKIVVSIFHPCHQKLLLPLVYKYKRRITISNGKLQKSLGVSLAAIP